MRPEERSSAVGRVRDQFPVGMRVLAVDDDPVCLKVLETLLRRCQYHVTTTNQAAIALKMLRENREMFDLVISDVHMPDMDGFKLLELVGLEMDLPVIMLSVNGETKTVMKGITHGACDYLLKPVRIEELRNIWQHVVRRKFSNRDRPNIDTYEECNKPSNADRSQITCGSPDQSGRPCKKRKEYHSEEDDDEGDESNGQENEDPSAPKKPRVVWSVELHRKFVAAVNHLGIDKAVPKRILELMNVEKLTRENVASHLQKYRLYLKRLSAVASQQARIVAALGGSDPFMHMGAFEGLQGYQTFTSSAALSSFSPQGLSSTSNPTSFAVQGMDASRSIHIANSNSTISHSIHDAKHSLSLPGNRQGNLAHGLTTSLGQVQLPQEWINEETVNLSAIGLANGAAGTLQSVTNSPSLHQEFVECREAKVVVQPLIQTSTEILEHLGGTVGVSSSLMDSRVPQQSYLPLSTFSASGLPMNRSFGNNVGKLGAASSGGTLICSSNDLRVARDNKVGAISFCSRVLLPPGGEQNSKYLNFGNVSSLGQNTDADNLLDSKQVWSSLPSSQLLGNVGAYHPVSQRLNNGSLGARIIGQASAGASTAAPQAKVDMLVLGDTPTLPKNALDFSIPKLQSELSSSSCSFDGLLNSIIKVEKDDASFSDDLGCDFHSLGACI